MDSTVSRTGYFFSYYFVLLNILYIKCLEIRSFVEHFHTVKDISDATLLIVLSFYVSDENCWLNVITEPWRTADFSRQLPAPPFHPQEERLVQIRNHVLKSRDARSSVVAMLRSCDRAAVHI